MSIELTLIISIISVLFAIYAGANNLKRNNTTDIKKDAYETATINVKLDTIGKGIEDIKVEQRSTNKDVTDLRDRVLVVEESTKSAHHRIDEIKGKDDK
ncbi:peptidoglycan hydrolase CwlO-like protein [Sedimentibacter acidaminivorans]|uniref:Peptidoglycan hydrolase CwlO-like protein n=1 Tax=Sedimentibacter acidaminivorans TaxID=913099 RepID=A0ABS4GA63_9FIRM|nr:hypothetical protein [Sedimentibacter acidaminivorans]MBP1924578.1 peptidoglycan hydrolase CwlO-like protein [Sedimentibacter acidaminivorans]